MSQDVWTTLDSDPRGVALELYLQFGYGMLEHSRQLIQRWGGGRVILSPRDLSVTQLVNVARDIRRLGGEVLVDPQFYLPHSDHERLQSHDYWPSEYESTGFWSGTDLTQLLTRLSNLNQELGCTDFILPGVYASAIDGDWLARQGAVVVEASRYGFDSPNRIATVALSSEVTRDADQIHALLDEANNWDVGGFYLVCEHPRGDYLVTDPLWLANTIDLIAGFRLRGKRVIVGYCNQQMLIAACASATAIASGTWMNVRSFPPDKFREPYEDEVRQRRVWYYCPQALSEFRVTYLDIASRQGVLNRMATPAALASSYANVLFQGAQPTTVAFPEPLAFRHYLQCLRGQTAEARRQTFNATLEDQERQLDEAESLLSALHSAIVRGQHRDFSDAIDANRAALSVLQSDRGPLLNRYWDNL